jgi:kynurenine formamidase
MRRLLLAIMALAGGMLVNAVIELRSTSDARAASEPPRPKAKAPATPLGPSLADLAAGRLEIVDLAWPINAQSAFWPGDNYRPFELHTLATLEKDGVLSKAFSMPEHLGTHLDAPNHFEKSQPSVDQIAAGQLFSPGVLVDVSAKVALDPDYLVSLDDLREFEEVHGPIPSGSVVLAYTGWSKFWGTPDRYKNQDVMSRLHFPGFSAEAAAWLVQERQARGLGLDTLSVDYGLSRDFAVHHVLGKAGRYGLENLANLDKLPPRDFYVFVAPIKIETGSGGPVRVFAVWPKSGAAD